MLFSRRCAISFDSFRPGPLVDRFLAQPPDGALPRAEGTRLSPAPPFVVSLLGEAAAAMVRHPRTHPSLFPPYVVSLSNGVAAVPAHRHRIPPLPDPASVASLSDEATVSSEHPLRAAGSEQDEPAAAAKPSVPPFGAPRLARSLPVANANHGRPVDGPSSAGYLATPSRRRDAALSSSRDVRRRRSLMARVVGETAWFARAVRQLNGLTLRETAEGLLHAPVVRLRNSLMLPAVSEMSLVSPVVRLQSDPVPPVAVVAP